MTEQRDVLEFDVVIVGGGPAGLSSAIKLRQQTLANNQDISVCVVEKAATIGAHNLAGAVLEIKALEELLPNWQELDSPIITAVTKDEFRLLTEKKSYRLPTPPTMHNEGNYIISLSRLVRWLAVQAESLGVEIYPGFPASDILYDDSATTVVGVITGDVGIGKDGEKTQNYQPGVELRAKYTIFAEGCRGSLSGELMRKFNLRSDKISPQTYALGIKELWESKKANVGEVLHTIGWPLPNDTYGGSFVYHLEAGKIALGVVVGLDYRNPYLSPYQEFQRFKHHPSIAKLLKGGKRIAYGARTLNEGGWQSIPQLAFPGGMLVGCAAGFLNVPKIKGIHTAMKSGMMAADSVLAALQAGTIHTTLNDYETTLRQSWVGEELNRARNIRPSFHYGLWAGLVYSAIDTYILRGRAPWSFKNRDDHKSTQSAKNAKPIDYPKPDGQLSFSQLENLSYSDVNHSDNQPSHLKLEQENVAVEINWSVYAGLETRYCPAGVYEYIHDSNQADSPPHLVINAQNCLHCKACDIKDPTQNIHWTTPEGGGGPNYESM